MLRWRRKSYNVQLAPRMWRYVIDAAAKVYVKEVAPDERWDRVLSPATRDIVAAEMTQDFERLAAAGSFDGLVARSKTTPRTVAPAPLAALFTPPTLTVVPAAPAPAPAPMKMPEPEFVVRRRAARAAAVATTPMQQLIAGPAPEEVTPAPEERPTFPASTELPTPVEVFYRRKP